MNQVREQDLRRDNMLAYEDYTKQKKRRGNFRNTTKQERAKY